ncbi:MAG: SirB1 family protein [Actinomycetota bacterium]
METTKQFALAMNRPEQDIDLAEACFLIARHIYPTLDLVAQMHRLDALAVRCPSTFEGMRHYLFEDLGFIGNTERYDDPKNSFLNDVLELRTGLPITLSIVVMEVGRRIGVPISGISMPAHFMTRHESEPRLYLDAFAGGETMDASGCRDRFHEIVGADVPFDPSWLKPASKTTIIDRVLANLKDVFTQRTQWQNVEWVIRSRLSIPGFDPLERRDLATSIASQGRFDEAARELELTAGTLHDPEERHTLLSEAVTMRAKLN